VSDLNCTPPMKRCKRCGCDFPATTEYFYEQKFPNRVILKSVCKRCFMDREINRLHNPDPIKYPSWTVVNADFPELCEQPNMTKRCTKCGVEYPHTTKYFHRNGKQAWGLCVICKSCIQKHHTEYFKRPDVKRHGAVYRKRPDVKERQRVVSNNRRNAPGSFTAADIEAIRVAQGNRCYICHKKLTKYHIDHFIPLALGGTHDPGNLRLACPKCNMSKHDKHPHDMGLLI
jgi:5-methylcytosine-specific restriction endonuclease McrA